MNKFQEFKMVAEAFMSEADLKTTAQFCLKTNPKSYAEFERVFIDIATSRGFIEKGMLTITKNNYRQVIKRKIVVDPLIRPTVIHQPQITINNKTYTYNEEFPQANDPDSLLNFTDWLQTIFGVDLTFEIKTTTVKPHRKGVVMHNVSDLSKWGL